MHHGKKRTPIKLTEPEQHAKDVRRLLVKAEQQIMKLQEKVADQKQLLREFQAQARHEVSLATEREELKAEIADLRSEANELIRANRQQVEKIESLQAEIAKQKADARAQKPNGTAAGTDLRGLIQPLVA
jgi:DNA repair exonuclease SbcCD ATPase subunit